MIHTYINMSLGVVSTYNNNIIIQGGGGGGVSDPHRNRHPGGGGWGKGGAELVIGEYFLDARKCE